MPNDGRASLTAIFCLLIPGHNIRYNTECHDSQNDDYRNDENS